jgi:hypothetical protein
MKLPTQSASVTRNASVQPITIQAIYPAQFVQFIPQQRIVVELIPQLFDWKCTIDNVPIPCSLLRWVFN